MAKNRNQLQIIVDQLSLDKATGSYLNVISGNYGLNRPFLGFSDAQWRAATKILALQYKQITNKFRDILAMMLGPQYTLTANLRVDVPVGVYALPVHSAAGIPQTGVLTLDAGLTTEETLSYKLIDYASNVIILTDPTQYAHIAAPSDAEATLLSCPIGGSQAVVSNAQIFPQDFSGGKKYSITLARGTDKEEVVQLLGNDLTTSTLTISTAQFDHVIPQALPGVSQVTRDYSTSSFTLYVNDIGYLPESGILRLRPNSSTVLLALYTSRNPDENTVNLKYTLPVAVTAGTPVEVIPPTSLASLGQIRFPGVDWDVIQSTPRKVEILVPRTDSGQDLRTASYLHDAFVVQFSALSDDYPAGTTQINVTPMSGWPIAGTLRVYTGFSPGFDTEYVGYFIDQEDNSIVHIPHGFKYSHLNGDTLEYWGPNYSEISLPEIPSGDIFGPKLYPFAGPYVYSPDDLAPKSTVATTLAAPLAAPSPLALDINPSAGPAVVEVDPFSEFPTTGSFTMIIGDETLTATACTNPSMAIVTLVSTASNVLTVSSISATDLPVVGGFRLLVTSSPDLDEIVWVTAVDTGTNELTLENPLQTARAPGTTLIPLGDLITVTQVDEFHKGLVPYASRAPAVTTTLWPVNELPRNTTDLEIVTPIYTSVSLTSGTGFPTSGGNFIVDFGMENHEDFSYTSRSGNTLTTDPFTPTKTHLSGDNVNYSAGLSVPPDTGYGFPLRLPVSEFDNVKFLIDLVRAAGVQVEFIYKR